jgi:hypothetical protein
MSILSVSEKTLFDNSIRNAQNHSQHPHASTSFNNNDKIRIQQQDRSHHDKSKIKKGKNSIWWWCLDILSI